MKNLNSKIIVGFTVILTVILFLLCFISLETLEGIPDLSLSRRMGIPWSPTYGLTRAVWCVLHGDFRLAVKYNPFIFFFFPFLSYQYIGLIRQCFRLCFARKR